ncbi:hypothetical protein BCF59_0057 [Mycoplasmopsis mustelae]|uniref:Uncharacterized protein n=1 Tax=Mycoplasmopsis mustelae TaxID=171289 RepID=A0A4R7UCF4_9BACT|nr:hypothetical protein [Mycoplasmopsis mustelae]TDV24112.1 hypothetical protein BCF59_0057 [Mycoplasmopsis mustelae]
MKMFINFVININNISFSLIKNNSKNYTRAAEDETYFYNKFSQATQFIDFKLKHLLNLYAKEHLHLNLVLDEKLFEEISFLNIQEISMDLAVNQNQNFHTFLKVNSETFILNTYNYQFKTDHNGIIKSYNFFPLNKEYQSVTTLKTQLQVKTNLEIALFFESLTSSLTEFLSANHKNTYLLNIKQQLLAQQLKNQTTNNLLVNIDEDNLFISLVRNGYILKMIKINAGINIIYKYLDNFQLSKSVFYARLKYVLKTILSNENTDLDEINQIILEKLQNFSSYLNKQITYSWIGLTQENLRLFIYSKLDFLLSFFHKKVLSEKNVINYEILNWQNLLIENFNLIHHLDIYASIAVWTANNFAKEDSSHLQVLTKEIELSNTSKVMMWRKIKNWFKQ